MLASSFRAAMRMVTDGWAVGATGRKRCRPAASADTEATQTAPVAPVTQRMI
jgi:hypothetical protein